MFCSKTIQAGFIQARPSKIQGLFKDFSRTNLTIFKDLLLRNTYTYLSIIETMGPATLAFGGGSIIILSLVLSLWVDAVVEVSVLTLASFLIKKFVKVPDKDCSCFLCLSPLACERKALSPI